MPDDDRSKAIEPLRRLQACAENPAWSLDEGNQAGFAIGVDFAFEEAPAFSPYRVARCEGGCVVHAEWIGPGRCLADIARDIFSVLGHVSEETAFVDRDVLASEIVYRLIVGSTRGIAEHGHFLTIHVGGEMTRAVLEELRKNQREWEQLARDSKGNFIIKMEQPPSV